jgi:uncharacterized spore protein YtfJ
MANSGNGSTVSDIVRQLLEGMHAMSKTETIIGDPIEAQHATLIPVHRLKIGFAAGTATGHAAASARQGDSGGRGAAGTVQLDPVAVIAVSADGVPRVLAVDGEAEGALTKLVDQLPDIVMRAAKGLGERVVAGATGGAIPGGAAETAARAISPGTEGKKALRK